MTNISLSSFNVGPPSATLAQQWNNIGLTFCVFRVCFQHLPVLHGYLCYGGLFTALQWRWFTSLWVCQCSSDGPHMHSGGDSRHLRVCQCFSDGPHLDFYGLLSLLSSRFKACSLVLLHESQMTGITWSCHKILPAPLRYVGPMLIQCWASVVDGGSTLDQHRANLLCILNITITFTIHCCATPAFLTSIPADTRRWINAGLTLVQRRGRYTSSGVTEGSDNHYASPPVHA